MAFQRQVDEFVIRHPFVDDLCRSVQRNRPDLMPTDNVRSLLSEGSARPNENKPDNKRMQRATARPRVSAPRVHNEIPHMRRACDAV